MLTESILEVPGLEAEEHGGDQHEEAVVEQQSVLTQLLQVNNDFILRSRAVTISVGDPDPDDAHVFGPPGSGSTSQRYGSGSGSGSFPFPMC